MAKYGSVSNWIIKATVKNWNTNSITGQVFCQVEINREDREYGPAYELYPTNAGMTTKYTGHIPGNLFNDRE